LCKAAGLGIHTGADLKAQSRAFLEERFGKSGGYYYWIARGIDDRPVRPDRVRKSIGAENTFAQDVWSLPEASAELQPIIDKVWSYCEQTQVRGRTVTLKVKFQDFQQITRSRSFSAPVESRAELANGTLDLLAPLFPTRKGMRLLGVSLSGLNNEDHGEPAQLSLSLPS
jgi:DNA polymerase IV